MDDGDGGEIRRDESKDEDDDLTNLIQLDDDLFSFCCLIFPIPFLVSMLPPVISRQNVVVADALEDAGGVAKALREVEDPTKAAVEQFRQSLGGGPLTVIGESTHFRGKTSMKGVNWQIFPGRLDCSRVAGSKRTHGDQSRSFAEKVVRSDSRMFSQCWK